MYAVCNVSLCARMNENSAGSLCLSGGSAPARPHAADLACRTFGKVMTGWIWRINEFPLLAYSGEYYYSSFRFVVLVGRLDLFFIFIL